MEESGEDNRSKSSNQQSRKCCRLSLKDILNFASTLVLPIMLGGFTIFISLQQNQIAREERIEDRKEALEKHKQELESAKEDRENQMQIVIEQHRDNVLVEYIKDMGDMLKENNFTLTHNKKIAALVRARTLSTVRQLDGPRNSQILRFLYESMLLTPTRTVDSLDISTAFFVDLEKATLKTIKSIGALSLVGTTFENCSFLENLLENGDLSSTYFRHVNFSSSQSDYTDHLHISRRHVKSTVGELIDVNFDLSTLEYVDFLFGKLDNIIFSQAKLTNVRFNYARLRDIKFQSSTLHNIDFSYSQLVGIDFSLTKMRGVNFSFAVLNNVRFSLIEMIDVNFSSAILWDVTFLSVDLDRSTFESSVLVDAEFRIVKLTGSDFTRVRRMVTRFQYSDLREVSFTFANMKDAIFEREVYMDTANFSGANLQRAKFIQANRFLTDQQLNATLSIHNSVGPNGTLLVDRNLLNFEKNSCDSALMSTWTIESGRVNIEMFVQDWNRCDFILESDQSEAVLSKRVSIENLWNPHLWPSTYAVLSAELSAGVTIEIIGINRNHTMLNQQSTSQESNDTSIVRLKLQEQMYAIGTKIHFQRNGNQSNRNQIWCRNVQLFLNYGTEVENQIANLDLVKTAKWNPNGVTVLEDLLFPLGLAVDQEDGTVFVADSGKHLIVASVPKNLLGRVVAGGYGLGFGLHQLNSPTNVLIDKETRSLIICDARNRRVMSWFIENGTTDGNKIVENIGCWSLLIDDAGELYVSDNGQLEVRMIPRQNRSTERVAGGSGPSNRLHQLSENIHIALDNRGALYISDPSNHRILKLTRGSREGVIVAGGKGNGHNLTHLSGPQGVVVDNRGVVYVVEQGNHRVTRWLPGCEEGEIIAGGHGPGREPNQLDHPVGLAFDTHGNLYVADSWNHRVQRFSKV